MSIQHYRILAFLERKSLRSYARRVLSLYEPQGHAILWGGGEVLPQCLAVCLHVLWRVPELAVHGAPNGLHDVGKFVSMLELPGGDSNVGVMHGVKYDSAIRVDTKLLL